ncbi:hypothetical protein BH10PSE7_BH10PSE7_04980 [soil metagenome]
MTILHVGPTSTFPTIAAAMLAGGNTDTIILEPGYSNETATVTHTGMTISGDASSTGIILHLAVGIPTFTATGTAPITIYDATDGNNIVGNAGDNVIVVTDGADAVNGGLGEDRLMIDYHLATGAVTGDSTTNVAEAGGSRLVTITDGTFEHFTILTGSGADTLTTGSGDDSISAGSGANTITAGQGANTVTGGSGADTITTLDGGNIINGGNGANTMTSGGGNDTISGGVNADTIVAGGGDDLITLFGGADSTDSGAGVDRLVVNYSALTTAVSGGVTSGTLLGGYTGHIGDGATNTIDFMATENFTITTGSGNDMITTGDGSDILSGYAGSDTMRGGGGDDIYIVDSATDIVVETVGNGNDKVYTSVTYTLGAGQSIELLATGSVAGTAAINLTGNSFAQSLIGNNGANTLNGNGGGDTMTGCGGNDAYIVVNSADQVVEAAGQGSDTVYSAVNYTLAAGQSIELLATGSVAGVTAINLTGNGLAQTIFGNNGANILNSGGGGDSLYGFDGNDTYLVGSPGDQAFESAGQGTDTVYTSSHYTLAAGQSIELLATGSIAGVTAINLTGNEIAQTIYGNNGNNVLNGMGGSDTIWVFGGQNQVVFNTALGAGNVDTVQGFTVVNDTFWLDDAIFGALGPSVTADELRIGAAAVDGNDYLIYNSATGALSYDANGVGGAAAVQFATLSAGLALTNFDFAII